MKIFVVTGTQEPFDRMIRAIDKWAGSQSNHEIFAQISSTYYRPESIEYTDFISPDQFDTYFMDADLIISHAGMGTIISALSNSKPIIVMPRLAIHHEHRNNHQLATAKSFEKLGYIKVAYTEEELVTSLNSLEKLEPFPEIGKEASKELLSLLRDFIARSE